MGGKPGKLFAKIGFNYFGKTDLNKQEKGGTGRKLFKSSMCFNAKKNSVLHNVKYEEAAKIFLHVIDVDLSKEKL